MKKLISILLLGGIVLSLSGCVSQKDYKDLEKRVAQLEQKQNIPQQTNITKNIQQTNETEISTATNIDNAIWTLDNMSTDDIYTELINISKCIKTGDTKENILKKLKIIPEYTSDTDFNLKYSSDNDCISRINLQGVIVEMDNTYTVKNNGLVYIYFNISDYNTASTLYDKMYKYLTTLNYGELNKDSCYDNRDGSQWQSEIRYKHIEVSKKDYYDEQHGSMNSAKYYYTPYFYIKLIRNEDSYSIAVSLPIINE